MTATPLSDPVLEAAAQIAAAFVNDPGALCRNREIISRYPNEARMMIEEAARQLEALKEKDDE